MKPRLQAPLTEEDGDIWLELARVWPFGAKQRMLDSYMLSDVRDADLMNWAQTIRRVRAGGYRMLGPLDDRVSAVDPNPIEFGGDITRFVR